MDDSGMLNLKSRFDTTLTALETSALTEITDTRSGVWIVVDGISEAVDAVRAVEATGARVLGRLTIDEAVAAEDAWSGLALIDVGDVGVAGLALLDIVAVRAFDAHNPAIIICSSVGLDAVAARADAPFSNILCAPTMADRIAAISLASLPAVTQFLEFDTMADALRLQTLATEVQRIAKSLAGAKMPARSEFEAFSDGLIGYRAEPVSPPPTGQRRIRAEEVRAIIRLRRQREQLFQSELFADPAWDMMLDLMAARIERLKVAVSSLCIAASVPPTTALRWIRTLTDMGLFVRVADPTDGRRVFIELSDATADLVLRFLGDAKRADVAVV